MIKSVHIQNFQSHPDTNIIFSPGVNIIVGNSDSGKSAVLRALKWNFHNFPSGNSFRSHWGGETLVNIELDEFGITRYKDKSNGYKLLTKDNKKPSIFEALGTGTPDEIAKLINLSDINFQGQMDGPFLLSKNPGEVARHFNSVAHLDKIDSSLKNAESYVRQARKDIQDSKGIISELEDKRKSFDYLSILEKEVKAMENKETDLIGMISYKKELVIKLEDSISIQNSIIGLGNLADAEVVVNEALSLLNELDILETKKRELKIISLDISQVDKRKEKLEKFSMDTKVIDQTVKLIKEKENLTSKFDDLFAVLLNIRRTLKEMKVKHDELQDNERAFHKLMPKTCPLCGK